MLYAQHLCYSRLEVLRSCCCTEPFGTTIGMCAPLGTGGRCFFGDGLARGSTDIARRLVARAALSCSRTWSFKSAALLDVNAALFRA